MDWVSLIQQFGLPVALTLFFVWQGTEREKRLCARLDTVEDYIKDELVTLIQDYNATVQRNTEVMEEFEQWFRDHAKK